MLGRCCGDLQHLFLSVTGRTCTQDRLTVFGITGQQRVDVVRTVLGILGKDVINVLEITVETIRVVGTALISDLDDVIEAI